MTKNTIIVGALFLAVGLGVGYTLWGSSTAPSTSTHMMGDGSVMGQNIDQHFIVQMIPHHEGAIAMAKIALERSKRPEMLTLAKAIIKAQEGEIADMRGWYQSWYGSAVPQGGMGIMRPSAERGSTDATRQNVGSTEASGPNVHMGSMTGDTGVLKTVSATDFDREFIDQMIPHHEMAVMMAQMLQAATKRPEMKQLASNIITSQSSEIETMRGWRASWYGIE